MSTIEMKGEIFELVSTVRTEDSLEDLLLLVRTFVAREVGASPISDNELEMTPSQEAAIRRAIERSDDETNFISNEEAQKRLSKWLKA